MRRFSIHFERFSLIDFSYRGEPDLWPTTVPIFTIEIRTFLNNPSKDPSKISDGGFLSGHRVIFVTEKKNDRCRTNYAVFRGNVLAGPQNPSVNTKKSVEGSAKLSPLLF